MRGGLSPRDNVLAAAFVAHALPAAAGMIRQTDSRGISNTRQTCAEGAVVARALV